MRNRPISNRDLALGRGYINGGEAWDTLMEDGSYPSNRREVAARTARSGGYFAVDFAAKFFCRGGRPFIVDPDATAGGGVSLLLNYHNLGRDL
ncbi:hypothetical protein AVEN_265272-1 [Araneus ventricosus]|uniref:Uncharacterized protein n=1 Tax=Araneus ventricosus TaxID=182803 RepID=A0A4Y2JZH1_ARAVE|nr:hypothetical protein AVEN_265272-1 [Araneus ventricosus]